jgi:wiskott-aldrich syndrome protein homolog 1
MVMVALSLAACSNPAPKNNATTKPTAKATASTNDKTKAKKDSAKNNLGKKSDPKGANNATDPGQPGPAASPAPASPLPAVNGTTGTVVSPFGSFSAGPALPKPPMPVPFVNVPGNPSGGTSISIADPTQGDGGQVGSAVTNPAAPWAPPTTTYPASSSKDEGVTTDVPHTVPSLTPGGTSQPGAATPGGNDWGTDDPSGIPPISIPDTPDLPINPSTPGNDGGNQTEPTNPVTPDVPVAPPTPGGDPTAPVNPGGNNGGSDKPVAPPVKPVSPAQQARIDAAQKVLSDASAKVVQAKADLAAAQSKSAAAHKTLDQARKDLAAAKARQADAIASLATVQAEVDSTSGMVSMRAQYADAAARSQFSKAGAIDWSKVSENDRARITASILAAKINSYRENMGLPALPSVESLTEFSQEWSTAMATGKVGFGHDRARLSGYLGNKPTGARITNINENVAYTNSNNPVSDANYLFSLLRNSQVHDTNMKADDMNAMGVSVAYDQERGVYATMNMVRFQGGDPHEKATSTDVSEVDGNVAWNTNTKERHLPSVTPQIKGAETKVVKAEDLPKRATSEFTVADIQKPVIEKDIADREAAAGVDHAEAVLNQANSDAARADTIVHNAEDAAGYADVDTHHAQDALEAAQGEQAKAQANLDEVIANPIEEAAEAPTEGESPVAAVSDESPMMSTDVESEAVSEAPVEGHAEPVAEEAAPAEGVAPVEETNVPTASTEAPQADTDAGAVEAAPEAPAAK